MEKIVTLLVGLSLSCSLLACPYHSIEGFYLTDGHWEPWNESKNRKPITSDQIPKSFFDFDENVDRIIDENKAKEDTDPPEEDLKK